MPGAAEPSLIDWMLILVRYRGWVMGFVGLGAAAGLTLALTLPRIFACSTTIEIGTIQSATSTTAALIENPESVIAKVTNAVLPTVEREHGMSLGEPGFTLGMDIKNPRGTALLVMTSKASDSDQQLHQDLHRRVADRLIADHAKELQVVRNAMSMELEQAKRALEAERDQAKALTVQRGLLEAKRTLTTQRLAEIEGELTRIVSNRDTAGKNLSGHEQVLTLMMLDVQMGRERDRRDELQRQLALGLVEETERIARDEKANLRAQQECEGRIAAIQGRIAHIAETRPIDEPRRSQRPVGMGRTVIVAMGLLVGGLLGIAAAMLRNAIAIRAQQAIGGA